MVDNRAVTLHVSTYNERRNTTNVFAYITGSVEPGQSASPYTCSVAYPEGGGQEVAPPLPLKPDITFLARSACSACVNFLLIFWDHLGYVRIRGPIFMKFLPDFMFIVDCIWLSFSDLSRGITVTANFKAKSAEVIHLWSWHCKMDWNFALPIGELTAAMIWLYRVKIWWTSVR